MPATTEGRCAWTAGKTLVFIFLCPVLALAQQPASPGSFGKMPSQVKAGNVVIVTDSAGREVRGKVTDVSEASLAILTKDDDGRWASPATFTPANVQEVKRTGKIWDKAVLGFAIGAGIDLVAWASAQGDVDAGDVALSLLLTGGIGAGIGFAFDAGFGPKRIYRAPSVRKAGLTLWPIVTPSRSGAALAYRF